MEGVRMSERRRQHLKAARRLLVEALTTEDWVIAKTWFRLAIAYEQRSRADVRSVR